MIIQLTQSNINNGHIYIPRHNDLLPADTWGGGNRSEKANDIFLQFEGFTEILKTDIDGKKAIFRRRSIFKDFFKQFNLQAGDKVQIIKICDRVFKIVPYIHELALSVAEDKQQDLADLDHALLEKKYIQIERIIRDNRLAVTIKKLYDFKCQICNLEMTTAQGKYAEAAHIRPLDSPHNGQDLIDNLLCLCPNHHVMLDYGLITINPDFTLNGISGKLFIHNHHAINMDNISYHQKIFGYNAASRND